MLYLYKMEKRLTEEIDRFRKLSGLPLITEQAKWLLELAKKGTKRIESMDQILKNLGYSGKNLTDNEIDDVIEQIRKQIDVPSEVLEKFKIELKNNLDLRRSLTNFSDNFVDKLLKSKKSAQATFQRINYLTKEQLRIILDDTVRTFLNKTDNYVYKFYDSFDTQISNLLESLFSKNRTLRNEEDMWNIIDGLINDNLVVRGFDNPELSDALFQQLKQKYRTNSKIKDSINKFKTNNKLNNGANVEVPPTPKFSTTKVAENYKNTSSWVKETKDQLPDTVNNVPVNKLDDSLNTPKTLEESEKNIKKFKSSMDNDTSKKDAFDNGEPDPVFINNWVFKIQQIRILDSLIDILRVPFKSLDEFKVDMDITQKKIIENYDKLQEAKKGVKVELNGKIVDEYAIEEELVGWLNRLRSNLTVMQSTDETFKKLWNDVKLKIKNSFPTDQQGFANDIINYCEKSVDISRKSPFNVEGRSLINFIELIDKHTSTPSWKNLNILKTVNTKRWSTTGPIEYINTLRTLWKNEKGLFNKVKSVMEKMLESLVNSLIGRMASYFTFGTFRNLKDMLLQIQIGAFKQKTPITIFGVKITNKFQIPTVLQRIVGLYIKITLIKNLFEPIIDFIKNTYNSFTELDSNKSLTSAQEENPLNQLVSDLKNRIPGIGNEFEWNPFLNPLSFIPGTRKAGEALGFKRAPLPEFIVNDLLGLFIPEKAIEATTYKSKGRTAQDVLDNYEKEYADMVNDVAIIINEQERKEYELNPQEIEEKNNKSAILKSFDSYNDITYMNNENYIGDIELLNKIRNAFVFVPGLKQSEVNNVIKVKTSEPKVVKYEGEDIGLYYPDRKDDKFVPNQKGVDLKFATSNEIPKNSKLINPKPKVSDFKTKMGYWALRSRSGELYELKTVGGWAYFITPSIEKLSKSVDEKQTLNKLKDFAKYL